MENLRKEAREAVQKDLHNLPPVLRSAMKVKGSLLQLWENVSQYDNSTMMNACESLLVATNFLEMAFDPLLPNDDGPRQLGDEAEAIIKLSEWASDLALPSSEFAGSFDESIEVTPDIQKAQDESRVKGNLAMDFLLLLSAKTDPCMGSRKISDSASVVIAMVSFISKENPWATDDSADAASMQLSVAGQDGLWPAIEQILKEKIRPLFTKQRNPNITSEGRKNFHPVPLARFDGSTLDDSTRPWKNTDIYATSVLSWIVSQYKPADKTHLETHFPLLVPAILSLIDDSNISFKAEGCKLLSQLLKPIKESGSDILTRTNLTPVFEEAITPCLLSLPSITPENSSLKILEPAYTVLIELYNTVYKPSTSKRPQSQVEKDRETLHTSLAKILRSNLISSFHHISSSTPAAESSASFPYPRLSAFLMKWISIVVHELGIQTTKYLQDIVPLLQTTLSNPFGSAYPPLVHTTLSTTMFVILNAHPRIWRWRGELFAGLCACWLHALDDSKEKGSAAELGELPQKIRNAVVLLKEVLQNPVTVPNGSLEAGQVEAKEKMDAELKELVNADSGLEKLLDVDLESLP